MFKSIFVLAILIAMPTPKVEVSDRAMSQIKTIEEEPTLLETTLMIEELYQDKVYELQLQEKLEREELERQEASMQDVNFTSFNDPAVAYGKVDPKTFGTNEHGMATDKDGYVVLGTATTLCLSVKGGACGKYNSIPDGYSVYELGEELDFSIDSIVDNNGNPKKFKGKVYDSCGACFWKESRQRVDIFFNGGTLGKVKGKITRSN